MKRLMIVALLGGVLAAPITAKDIGPAQKANQLPLRLKDANGKDVGRPIWMGKQYVVLTVQRIPFAVHLRPYWNGLAEDYTRSQFQLDILYFTTPDCTGTPYRYFDELILGVAPASLQVDKAGRLLAFVASGVAERLEVHSFRSGQFDCGPSNDFESYVPVVTPPFDLSGRFSPPFALR
jgi:hypothetical protein